MQIPPDKKQKVVDALLALQSERDALLEANAGEPSAAAATDSVQSVALGAPRAGGAAGAAAVGGSAGDPGADALVAPDFALPPGHVEVFVC